MTTKEGDLLGELIAICERIVDAARSPREMSGMREISADEVEALEDVLSKATKDEDHEANARLIAAAPELLAVCVAIVAAWKSIPMYYQASSSMKDDEMWEAAQSAIAKATGIS